MEREVLKKLVKWKEYPFRKPLVMTGIRQVGKTWTLKEFGSLNYDYTAYFNFKENENYRQFFENAKDVDRIIQNLIMASGQRIEPEQTLIIFDDIQESPEVIGCLRNFFENGKEYHVVCAGNISENQRKLFPEDAVEFIELFPMNFKEFLRANGNGNLAAFLENINIIEPVSEAFYNPLMEKLRMYLITGGMPPVVLRWTRDRNVAAMEDALKSIIETAESDFVKKSEGRDVSKMSLIWHSVPSQLAKVNNKFTYSAVKEGARAREYEEALNGLTDIGLLKRLDKIDGDGFKTYFPDVGMLRKMMQLTSAVFGEGDRIFTDFNGALSENYVLKALIPQFKDMPKYWSCNNPFHKVDFIVECDNELVPIEVSGKTGGNSKNLRKYRELFPDKTPLTVRFSLDTLMLDRDKLNVPLFMADEAARLIGLALDFGKGLSLLDIL